MRRFGVLGTCLLWVLLLVAVSSTQGLRHAQSSLPFFSKYFPNARDGLISVARPLSWQPCDPNTAEADLFQLHSVTLSPDPPERSTPLTVRVHGYLKETLHSGELSYTVRFGSFKVVSDRVDGCEKLRSEPQLPQCPVEAGPIDITYTAHIPWHVPPGRYYIDLESRRKPDGKRIICLKVDVVLNLFKEDASQKGL